MRWRFIRDLAFVRRLTALGLALSLALPIVPLFGQVEGDGAADDAAEPSWNLITFALPFGSSDVGNGALFNVIAARRAPDSQSGQTLIASGATTDLGLNVLFLKGIHRQNRWIFSGDLGFVENPQAAYFERGNFQDLPEIRRIEEGRSPTPGNAPASPTVFEGTDASLNRRALERFLQSNGQDTAITPDELNPGREVLRQQQNRYYRYSVRRQLARLTIQRWLGSTPLLATAGYTGARTRIYGLGGDTEPGEVFENSTTLLEIDRPVGYDPARQSPAVFSNALNIGLEYNTLPEERQGHPDRGLRTGFRYEGAGKGTGSHFTYGRATVYHHHYQALFTDFFNASGRELVLAHRVFAVQAFEDIPFFEEKGLGGVRLRGYPTNQFVDRVQLAGSLELRWTFWPASDPTSSSGLSFGALAFVDSGRVGPEWRAIDTNDWHHAAGLGLNVIVGNRIAIELVAGRSRFEQFVSLSVGHSLTLRN